MPTSDAKQRLLLELKRRGPSTAGQLAEALSTTASAVRQHLCVLERTGEVESSTREPEGRGRPSLVFTLAAGASANFPDAHADLATDLLDAARKAFGPKGVRRLVEVRARDQLNIYQAELPGPDAPLGRRVRALAERRTREGYMAEVVRDGKRGYVLIEHHCPICEAAAACRGLCAAELDVFRSYLGPDVAIERTDHIIAGDHRCAYRIGPA